MKKVDNIKFKVAREALGYSQTAAAKESGWNQSRLSMFEGHPVSHVPITYLNWLSQKRINMSALFDPNIDEKAFAEICRKGTQLLLTGKVAKSDEVCEECNVKDKEIGMLNRIIGSLEKTVSVLESSHQSPRESAAG